MIIFSRFFSLLFFLFLFHFGQTLAIFAESPSLHTLVIKNTEGQVLLTVPVRSGQYFIIRYTHSVALSPVEDYFTIVGKEIVLDKTVYKDFGAGLPHMPEDNQHMQINNGKVIIDGLDRHFSSFDVRVGRVANHVLVLMQPEKADDQHSPLLYIPLDYLSKPGSALNFSIGTIKSNENMSF